MSFNLFLKPSCRVCGATCDLYGNCKHMTLCLSCGKAMAERHFKCCDYGEYNFRASGSNDKTSYIGRFVTGLPNFSKKKNTENKWSLQKEGFQGRQMTDGLRYNFNKVTHYKQLTLEEAEGIMKNRRRSSERGIRDG